MKFTFEELEQILDLSGTEKRNGIKTLFEKGKFDDLNYATKEEGIIAIQLNDSLLESDPFYLWPFIEYDDGYLSYFWVVDELMKDGRYKDIEQTYRCLERVHYDIGLSTRSKIYEAMVAVQRILKLPPEELEVIEID